MAMSVFVLFETLYEVFFYKKPGSRPSSKSLLFCGHIIVLKVSLKFVNLQTRIVL